MIKICENCSKANVQDLVQLVPAGEVTLKCLGHCDGHEERSFGIINGDLIFAESPELFTEAVKEKLKL